MKCYTIKNDCFDYSSLPRFTPYRPYDYVPPSTDKGKCTHTKKHGRHV
jgi:hypothetical protein